MMVYRDGHIDTETIGSEIDFVADMREQATHSKVVNAEVNLAISLTGYLRAFHRTLGIRWLQPRKNRFRSAGGHQGGFAIRCLQDKVIADDKGAKGNHPGGSFFDACLTGEAIVRKIKQRV